MPRKLRTLTIEEQKQVLELVEQRVPRKDIGNKLKIPWGSLKSFLDQQGIPVIKRGIPYEYYESIFELYNSGLTSKQIHDQHFPQFSQDQINYICRVKGITRSNGIRANVDHNYFEDIDSSEKAYWLGLLFADGCMMHKKDHQKQGWSISLSLMDEDAYIVEQFGKDIKSNLNVKRYINETGFSKQNGETHAENRLTIYSTKMCNDLKKYGIMPQKSLKLNRIPSLPEQYYCDFIRGFFDGNGSITYYWNKAHTTRFPRVIFYSTHDFCDSIRQLLFEKIGIKTPTVTDQKNAKVSLISYGSIFSVEKIYHYLYDGINDDDKHYMKRKKEKFEEYIGEYRDNYMM